jgi:iron(III) transport system permease protein
MPGLLSPRPLWTVPLALLLLAPLVAPALQGLGSAVLAAYEGLLSASGVGLWPSSRVQGLIGQSLVLSLLSGLLATALGALCALALLLPMANGRVTVMVALLAASFCLGSVVHVLVWQLALPGVQGGVAGWALTVAVLGWRYAAFSFALLAAGLAALNRAELEAALCTGGGAALWRVARSRLLKLAVMSVAAVAALVFSEPEVPPLLGVHVYAEEFLSQMALEPSSGAATALGWPLMAAALVGAAWVARAPHLHAAAGGAGSLGWLGQWAQPPRWMLATVPRLALVVAVLPLALLSLGAAQGSGRWPAHAGAALAGSVGVAALSAALACAWGWALAGLFARRVDKPGGALVLNMLLWLMMLWPSALTGMALAAWVWPAWVGAAPLVLAHALRVLPFAVWLLLAMQAAYPRGAGEQLRVLGAHGWTALAWVRLPQRWPALVAAFVLCAGLSLAELTGTVLTVPPGMETVILRLYNLLHYGDHRGVLMLALLQALVVALALLLAVLLTRRRRA